jgi:hypothetical protein
MQCIAYIILSDSTPIDLGVNKQQTSQFLHVNENKELLND